MEYLDCKCGSQRTYISVAGKVCCNPCFKPLTEKMVKKVDIEARIFTDSGGWHNLILIDTEDQEFSKALLGPIDPETSIELIEAINNTNFEG